MVVFPKQPISPMPRSSTTNRRMFGRFVDAQTCIDPKAKTAKENKIIFETINMNQTSEIYKQ